MPKTPQCQNPKMIPFATFDEYKDKYKELFLLERTESGVVTARFHTDGDSAHWDYPLHRGLHQLCHDIGQDAETEVLILGGVGNMFVKPAQTSIEETWENQRWALYEHSYYDGCNMVEALVNDVEQPTIGVINGIAVHSEIALLCDVTLMAEDAIIMDPHFAIGGAIPGDGIQIALRALMGIKRSNYAMLFNEKIDAQKALEYGLVNEVLPREKLYDRARELAEQIASKPRIASRLMAQTLRMPLKEQIAKELRTTFGTEMWNILAVGATHDEAFERMRKHLKK
ncbi:MAG: enoyl-CoA hydratase/isomerase family protein [Pseudoxanthomonas sp.]